MKDSKTKEYFFKKLLDIKKKNSNSRKKRKLNRKVRKKSLGNLPERKIKMGNQEYI